MELEEIQQQWQRLSEKLDRSLKLDAELVRLAVMHPARRRINRAAFWPALDIVGCLATILFTESFIGNHWNQWSIAGPAVVVLIAAFALLIDSVRQLHLVSEIDWSGTVVDIQSSLSRLSMAKIRQFKWVVLSSPLVGFCGLMVGLQWGLDWLPVPHFIVDMINPWWVAANYAFGALFIVFGHAVVRVLAKQFHCRGWWQRAVDDIAGSSMTKAREELSRWASLNTYASNGAG